MRSETLGSVVRRLRLAVAPAAPPAGPDADLVRAFAARRDPAAFTAIARRHGPMVLGVCSRVLRDPADADDAFQATFLVLVRKARSLSQPDRLAGWLHQVAQRTARKLRAVRLARARREGELFDVPVGEPVADFVWRELRPIFDQELGRLPDKLRLPAVLCFLEGHSKGEAARTLGWPEGTLAGRLQQAREKLRVRFAARGLTLSAGALAVALFEGVGSAAVSDRLIASTLQAAATGPAGATSAGVWALADGVTQAMFQTKAKAMAACVLAAGLVGTGTGVVLVPGSGPGDAVAGETPKEPPKKPAPAGRAAEPYNFVEGRQKVDQAVEQAVLTELRLKDPTHAEVRSAKDRVRAILTQHVGSLRAEVERLRPLIGKDNFPEKDWDRLQAEVRGSEGQLTRLPREPAKDPERATLQGELELLKERLDWEERMVKKGYMAESQVKKTKLEIIKAEAALAKFDSARGPDPRRAALEEIIRKAEDIAERTAAGVRRGIVPEQELLNTELTVLTYKLKLLELPDHPAGDPKVAAERRAAMGALVQKAEQIVAMMKEGVTRGTVPLQELHSAEMRLLTFQVKAAELRDREAGDPRTATERRRLMEATVHKLEQIVAQQAEWAKKGIVPYQALLNSELTLLRYELELLEIPNQTASTPPSDVVPPSPQATSDLRKALITQKETELRRAEALLKQNAISLEEVRRLKIDLAGLKAEEATAAGDHSAAVSLYEGIVAEWETTVAGTKRHADRGTVAQSELRLAEVALAEAKVDALKAGVRRQLAEIVRIREKELTEAKILFDAKSIASEDVRRVERALREAKRRLVDER
ncbi:MAG TPA: sigma-70 family RNA polymerase sigma factor [Gemmataceae bacterium]|nr:sigma-70 family RNA polymerase sigma factor [Gemmataceae bacterium]